MGEILLYPRNYLIVRHLMKTIDEIVLDNNNVEFNRAVEVVQKTNRTLFVTGKAGTGKTTFLKYIRQKLTSKNIAVVAPTGVAAINAKGQTIHSFFKIKPSIYPVNDKRLRLKAPEKDEDKSTFFDHFRLSKRSLEVIRNLDMLVIDEISMVRCDLLDVIDLILQVRRRRIGTPWGGVQVILIGDPFQLPPVTTANDWEILEEGYNSPFFFSAKVFEKSDPLYIELKKSYRQTEKDFINLLNKIRVDDMDDASMEYLNSRFEPNYEPRTNEIVLTTHNVSAAEINDKRNESIQGKEYEYVGEIVGEFPEKHCPTEKKLRLKVGSQVMFVKNDPAKKYFNGKITKVVELTETSIKVLIDAKAIEVEKTEWENIKFECPKSALKQHGHLNV